MQELEKNGGEARQLFICYTPFQLALVQRFLISDINLGQHSSIFYMGPDNSQSRKYCGILREYAVVECVKLSSSRVRTIFRLLSYLGSFDRSVVKTVFSANYKLIYTRIFLLFLKPRPKLFRFDDGMGDLLEKSWFTLPEHPVSRLFFKLFSPSLEYARLRDVPRRFTLYANLCGPETKHISLNDLNEKEIVKRVNSLPKVTVLLGQTYSNNEKLLTKEQELRIIKSVISRFEVDKFIPHPLSRLTLDDLDVEVVEPDVIAEQYIFKLLNDNVCHVVGFRTTAIFNLLQNHSNLLADNNLLLTNLTIYKDGEPLGENWENDIWAQYFDHVPVHLEN
jgi:hypothetical protein